ncbi:tryptophan 7-halogenase [Microbulbifer salipaludis]|uniref:Tryptophan 7-halogenase n=1 Tax=Microbulbifer salipaludis TaxID=187980 RepID=A0ABS3E6S1_9GAMM|nr:tryptophan 7-halogenase [Microbulbifer salipaludis]MBN8431000.1 tryptophan 7-halogenase [Microbulbifer salipaludis]
MITSHASKSSKTLRCVIYGNNPAAHYCLHYLYQQIPQEHLDVLLVAPPSPVSGAGFIDSTAAEAHCEIGISTQELLCSDIADTFLALAVTSPHNRAPQWLASAGYGFSHRRQPFFQWWQPSQQLPNAPTATTFNLNCLAAAAGRCGETPPGAPKVHQGMQFRYTDYCNHLAARARALGLTVLHQSALLSAKNGSQYNLILDDTTVQHADFILDCDGALLASAAADHGHMRTLLPVPANRSTQTPSRPYQRSPAASCVIEPTRWLLDIRGDRIDHQIIAGKFHSGFQSAWIGNLIGLGNALNLGHFAIDPLAQAQQQLQFLLPLLPQGSNYRAQQEEFNERVAQYNQQVIDLHSLCHWLAGHSRRLSAGAREQLALFRTCGRTKQADETLLSDETWLLLPLLAGLPPRKSAFPVPTNGDDYMRWLDGLAQRYRKLATTLPSYQRHLETLMHKAGLREAP